MFVEYSMISVIFGQNPEMVMGQNPSTLLFIPIQMENHWKTIGSCNPSPSRYGSV